MAIGEMRTNPTYSNYNIGRGTYGAPGLPWPQANLIIGAFCSIGDGVRIFLGGEHNHQRITTYPFQQYFDLPDLAHPSTKGDVVIGNDVWIGEGATILSGVTIGDGVVIGAYSVVAFNIEAYTIVAGNPATFLKYRFPITWRHRVSNLQWWNWSDQKLLECYNLMIEPLSEEILFELERRA
jgi:acetyltransferase-like isoleucine patch superfamily enzyme